METAKIYNDIIWSDMFMKVLSQNIHKTISHRKKNKRKNKGGHERKTKFIQATTIVLEFDNDRNKYSQLITLHEAMEWRNSSQN